MNLLKQARQVHALRRDWLGEGGQPSPKAQLRAHQCLQCPWHEEHPWEEFFKGLVARRIQKQLELKSQMQLTVADEEKLHLCGICKCVLKLKVHAPLQFARENTPDWEKMPAWCWLHWPE